MKQRTERVEGRRSTRSTVKFFGVAAAAADARCRSLLGRDAAAAPAAEGMEMTRWEELDPEAPGHTSGVFDMSLLNWEDGGVER